MRGWVIALSLALVAPLGCEKKKTAAEQVGDSFVEHYVHADQQGALRFAALGAATQLKKEIDDSVEARKDGAQSDIHVTFKRSGEEMRDKRIVLLYDVTLEGKNAGTRAMRLELADLGAGPKVVLFELK